MRCRRGRGARLVWERDPVAALAGGSIPPAAGDEPQGPRAAAARVTSPGTAATGETSCLQRAGRVLRLRPHGDH